MAASGGVKAVVAALFANLGIAITKLIAWILTGSSSMLAEAIHSLADSGNQVLLLLGGRRAKREATEQHQFGYGRERYIYSFIVSIVLFTVGGLFALYEAYHKWHELGNPEASALLTSQWRLLPVAVLVIAIILETLSFRTAIVETRKVKGNASYVEFWRHAKEPELPVILLEDLAALLGLFLALFGVSLSLLTGNMIWDVLGTAAIGLLLVVVAVLLAMETKSLLLGESASPAIQAAISADLSSIPGAKLVDLKTLHVGPDEILVAAKLAIVNDQQAIAEIAKANDLIATKYPTAKYVYLTPVS